MLALPIKAWATITRLRRAEAVAFEGARRRGHVNRTRLGAVAALVLKALNWLRVLWLALLLALLPRC